MKTPEPSNAGTKPGPGYRNDTRSGVQVADAAGSISRIAIEVAEGAEPQTRLLDRRDETFQRDHGLNGRDNAQLDSIATFVEEIVSSVNESAASIEQVSGNTPTLASGIAEIAASTEETARSVESVSGTAQRMATSAEEVTGAMTEIASSVKSVSQDTESLTAAVNQTAVSMEEVARSIDSLAGNADDLSVVRGTDILVDQRNGGFHRGGVCDDGEPCIERREHFNLD